MISLAQIREAASFEVHAVPEAPFPLEQVHLLAWHVLSKLMWKPSLQLAQMFPLFLLHAAPVAASPPRHLHVFAWHADPFK
jgi:hypothetical protein